jgi:hypothetical protein
VSYNGITSASQADEEGSTPFTRSSPLDTVRPSVSNPAIHGHLDTNCRIFALDKNCRTWSNRVRVVGRRQFPSAPGIRLHVLSPGPDKTLKAAI